VLALRFARAAGVSAYIVDPVTVDEWQDVARLTGSPLVERASVGHALNTKAVARRFAREGGWAYAELRLIVVHMGSGITVSAHRDGRTIDRIILHPRMPCICWLMSASARISRKSLCACSLMQPN
jgi:butyrate kinase